MSSLVLRTLISIIWYVAQTVLLQEEVTPPSSRKWGLYDVLLLPPGIVDTGKPLGDFHGQHGLMSSVCAPQRVEWLMHPFWCLWAVDLQPRLPAAWPEPGAQFWCSFSTQGLSRWVESAQRAGNHNQRHLCPIRRYFFLTNGIGFIIVW